jgi:hypothetical protein
LSSSADWDGAKKYKHQKKVHDANVIDFAAHWQTTQEKTQIYSYLEKGFFPERNSMRSGVPTKEKLSRKCFSRYRL